MAAAMQASPITCTCSMSCDSKEAALTGHQPCPEDRPLVRASVPGACGGMTYATETRCAPLELYRVRSGALTRVIRPPSLGGIHSIIPGYICAHAAVNVSCRGKWLLASKISTLQRLRCCFSHQAMRLARS